MSFPPFPHRYFTAISLLVLGFTHMAIAQARGWPWQPSHLPEVPRLHTKSLTSEPAIASATATPEALLLPWWKQPDQHAWLGDEAVAMVSVALTHQPLVEAAYQRWQQAHQQANVQRATLLPQLMLNPNWNRQLFSANQFVAFNNNSANRTFDFYSVPLQFNWELDVWGRLTQQLKASKLQAKAQQLQWQGVRLGLASDTLTSYWQWQALHQQKAYQQQRLTLAQQWQRYLHALVNEGAAPHSTEANQVPWLKDQERQLLGFEQGERLIARRLGTLLGKESDVEPQPKSVSFWETDPLPAAPRLPKPDAWIAQRPDLQAQIALLEASKLNVQAVHKLILPRLAINGQWGFLSTATHNLFDWKSHAYQIIPQLMQPVFAGGQIKAQQRLLQAQLAEQVATYQANLLQALQEVEQAQLAYQRDSQQEALLHEAIEAKESDVVDIERRVQVGSLPLLPLWLAQDELLQLQQARCEARLAVVMDVIQWQRLLGGVSTS